MADVKCKMNAPAEESEWPGLAGRLLACLGCDRNRDNGQAGGDVCASRGRHPGLQHNDGCTKGGGASMKGGVCVRARPGGGGTQSEWAGPRSARMLRAVRGDASLVCMAALQGLNSKAAVATCTKTQGCTWLPWPRLTRHGGMQVHLGAGRRSWLRSRRRTAAAGSSCAAAAQRGERGPCLCAHGCQRGALRQARRAVPAAEAQAAQHAQRVAAASQPRGAALLAAADACASLGAAQGGRVGAAPRPRFWKEQAVKGEPCIARWPQHAQPT